MLQNESVSQLFNGDTISPEFAVALKSFIKKNSASRSNFGFLSAPNGDFTIAHGLGGVPNMISINTYPASGASVCLKNPPADATYLYLNNATSPRTTYWAAAIIQ